jgi:hypothetical protein
MPRNEEQKMPTIRRNGRFVFIQPADLNKMLAAGTARKLGSMPAYEEIAKAQAPEGLDSVPDEDPLPEPEPEPKTYQTADMRAEPQRRRYRKTGVTK